MPSYFYHIALELLTSSSSNIAHDIYHDDDNPTGLRSDHSLANEAVREAFLPFQRYSNNKKTTATSHRHRSGVSGLGNGNNNNSNNNNFSGVVGAQLDDGLNGKFSSLSLQNPTCSEDTSIQSDLRFTQISIQGVDMVAPAHNRHRRPSTDARGDDRDTITTGIGTDIIGGLHTRGKYIPLYQTLADSVYGIVHLYRDAKETPSLTVDDHPLYLKGSSAAARRPPNDSPQDISGGMVHRSQLGGGHGSSRSRGLNEHDSAEYYSSSSLQTHSPNDEDCSILCILAVPSYLSPADFLGFVGEETRDEVSHFRMIKTARANRYMVLMKFRNGKKAREWQREWNGKVFNSMEPETCHVVFVKSVEIEVAKPREISDASNQSSTLTSTTARSLGAATSSPGRSSASLSAKPLAPPTPSLVELPTCPVCLERMDETTGLLTIICQHVFHCTCLQKWKGSGCPVCRYTLDDFARRGQVGFFDEGSSCECSVCHSELNLWVCLICGSIGCGRYDEAHAFAHFKETSHAFAMDLSTQRVWDYVSDAYVHRIIQSKTDGKLVELPAADNSALDPPDWTDAVPREKLENMSVEYTHLLTSQLESQRAYFEEIVERAVDKASKASAGASAALEAAEKATQQLNELQQRYDALAKDNVPGLEKEKDRAERRAEKFEIMARKLEKEWREEKAMNENLVKRVELLSEEVTKLKAENADLSEQNRDLTFFISGSEKLKEISAEAGDEDVVEGTVSIPEQQSSKRKGKGRRR
ncbi:RING and UBP finger domain protein, putative [Talaromyces marneffei ATCC 18224]|uniref:RING and UBP finger domain protein, putative n=1 Tax=Talaromyces marneffei (strain ATCC 18224 / CBS 334.59 / QM 7333) TaxID=441960 RepID=B6QPW6_TALMQ|nr:RING and UBP finger domain protein, putative [Talaromyces marneffei ATCC 18224]